MTVAWRLVTPLGTEGDILLDQNEHCQPTKELEVCWHGGAQSNPSPKLRVKQLINALHSEVVRQMQRLLFEGKIFVAVVQLLFVG